MGVFVLSSKNAKVENLFVKECIFTALMQLMENRRFSDITITEITARAGVSRMAYYRNYRKKEEIILFYLDKLFEEYLREISIQQTDVFQSACLYFSYFRKHDTFLYNLIRSDLTYLILARYDTYLQTIFQNFYCCQDFESDTRKYIVEFVSGGLFKILVGWAKDGMLKSDESMARIICGLKIF